MVKNYTSTFAKNNFGVIVQEVNEKGNTVIINKNNKPILEIKPYVESKKKKAKWDKYFGVSPDFPEVYKNRSFSREVEPL